MIKIDRSFVTTLLEDAENMAIVRAVTTLANALSVPVCVEGIERDSVHESVVMMGCQLGQGWYFGKPMSAEKARDLLAAGNRGDTPTLRSAASN
jgi:EAL domain-containing protein (putative c-di-GMP-specific phosphodiesterase class I)